VSVIDAHTNAVTVTIHVGPYPFGLAADPAAGTVYVTNYADGTVSVIDAHTNRVTATIPLGAGAAYVAADPAAGAVYVTNYINGTVSVIDPATNAVTATIPVGSNPYGVAADPAAGAVYVANYGAGTVSVIDAATNTVTATVPVGSGPYGMAADPAAGTAYVTNVNDDTVSVISTQAAQVITFTSAPPASPMVGGTYLVSATGGGSGNPVTFTIGASSRRVCSISGPTVTFNASGRCVIDANQAGNAGYLPAPQARQTVTVGRCRCRGRLRPWSTTAQP
jgi:YVTN family beta-propeller protein